MIVADLVEHLAPAIEGAAEWDPVGLQVGDPMAEVGSIGVCHEVTDVTVERAAGLDLLIAYHPLLFHPTTSFVSGPTPAGRAVRLVGSGTALFVVHTGWDTRPGGTADALAAALGLGTTESFAPVSDAPAAPGLGRVGDLPEPTTPAALATTAEAVLGATAPRVAGDPERPIRRIAVLPGSGADAVAAAAAAGAEALVTGDVSHHRATAALDAGVSIIDVGHAPSERPGMAALVRWVTELDAVPVVDLTDIVTSPWEGR
ncbi:MAG: Nif3-like dinuclear metal center hexameric protein [Acidimicrobiia bacterium]